MRRLAALLACAAACTGDPSAPHLARGNVLVNNGKRAEAAAEYREAARLAPKSSLPVERLGDVLYDLGRQDEALAAYREAAARDPGAFTARIGAARVLTALGRLSDARDELTIALRGQPTNLYLLLSRGNLYQRSGDPKAALRDYEAAVHLESRNVPALFQYGAALLEDGQLEEAGRTFDRLVEVAPDAPEGWFGRALWSARRGDRGRAAEGLAAANQRVEAAARRRLAEQGMKGEALDRATAETTQRSREQMEADPAFAPFAADPGFRRAAGFAARAPDAMR
ncbi:MAG TPA: tetratricopeptide repeat protein [Myxococcales bacterium]